MPISEIILFLYRLSSDRMIQSQTRKKWNTFGCIFGLWFYTLTHSVNERRVNASVFRVKAYLQNTHRWSRIGFRGPWGAGSHAVIPDLQWRNTRPVMTWYLNRNWSARSAVNGFLVRKNNWNTFDYSTSVGSSQCSPCMHRRETASVSGIWQNVLL